MIAHGLNAGGTVVVDDGQARACARVFNLQLIGTVGVVLRAKNRGLMPFAAPLIRGLLEHGLRLDDDLIRDALASVGEA